MIEPGFNRPCCWRDRVLCACLVRPMSSPQRTVRQLRADGDYANDQQDKSPFGFRRVQAGRGGFSGPPLQTPDQERRLKGWSVGLRAGFMVALKLKKIADKPGAFMDIRP